MKTKNILLVCSASIGLLAFTYTQNNYSQVVLEVSTHTDTSKVNADSVKVKSDKKVLEVVEEHPEFPGGPDSMMSFISKNFIYPQKALRFEITGRVLISFIVNENGKITDIHPTLPIEKQLGHGLEEEAMRVVSIMPDWKPGTQRGKAVKVKYTLPFVCTLDGVDEEKKKKKRSK